MNSEALVWWFTNDLLPGVIKSGKFSENGESLTLDKCVFEAIENYVSSFASVAYFAKLHLKSPSGPVTRDILVKFQSQDSLYREKMRTVPQYENEVNFYNQVYLSFVEFLKTCGQTPEFLDRIIPKCYFASNGNGDVGKAVLILRDLRGEGFRLSDFAMDLDLKHCLLSVEKLAQFHAISFAMKLNGWKDLDKLKQSFREIWFEDIPICREQCNEFLGPVSKRGINYLSSRKEVPVEYLNKLEQLLEPTFDVQCSLRKPREPLSVIGHGDFNRNNILYKYVNGELVDARFIDYQRTYYGSPSYDLGFLIYMNTTLEFREKHFDQIFDHYYSTLVQSVSVMSKQPEETIKNRFPIQAFREDFEKVGIYHYTIISFFIPIMMTPPDPDFEFKLKYQTFTQMAEENYNKGGDDVNRRIADVIVDFYRRKFYM